MQEPLSVVSPRTRKNLTHLLMKILNQSFSQLVACVTLLLALGSCSGGGSSGGDPSTSPAPAAGSVTITGTVSGTVIKVVSADNRNLLII